MLPASVDDPATPSGGNAYDRRVLTDLAALGRDVREHLVTGDWPRPAPAARAALAEVLARVPDDGVVLLDGLVACGVPEVLDVERARLRLVVLVHLPLPDEAGLAPAVAADLATRERAALDCARAVVTTSAWTAARLRARYGLGGAGGGPTVHVAPPGVDPAPPARGRAVTGAPPRLLAVGAVTPTKGHDRLVAALARLRDLSWTCEIVGPLDRAPGYVTALRSAIAGHGLAERVHLCGPRRGAALDATYAAADVVVVPSRVESYGMVVTEALARGIPVVASAVGGVAEAMGDGPPAGALVADSWDPAVNIAAFARSLRGCLEDTILLSGWKLSAHGRRGRLHPWMTTAERLARALATVPGSGPPA